MRATTGIIQAEFVSVDATAAEAADVCALYCISYFLTRISSVIY